MPQFSKGNESPVIELPTICHILDRQAQSTPDAIAVVDSKGSYSYRELAHESICWAQRLMDAGIGVSAERCESACCGDVVGIMLPRCKEFMMLELAIMRGGAAFMPIDPDYPDKRIDYMLAHAGVKTLITNSTLARKHNITVEQQILIDKGIESLEQADEQLCGQQYSNITHRRSHTTDSKTTLLPSLDEQQAAYVIFTSGTTGSPKGVVVSHKALMSLLSWYGTSIFECRSDDRFCAVNSLSFDASITDLYPPLLVGASVYIVCEEVRSDLRALRGYISDHNLTIGHFSTRLGFELLDGEQLPLRYAMLGGEKLTAIPRTPTTVVNVYGPTEFTVCSHFHIITPQDQTPVPIGHPAPGTASYVLDANLHPVATEQPGELYLSGGQLSRGYINDREQTEARFIENPYSDSESTRLMYRTGDIVKWNSEGELEYIGRIDAQIKIRGYRVDLSEIEELLLSFNGIHEAAVLIQDVAHHPAICAYFTTQDSEIDTAELSHFLHSELPAYSVPQHLIQLQKMPLTINGKLDKAGLLPPQQLFAGVEASSQQEKTLLDIARHLLDTSQIGITDDLTQAGLDSLGVMQFTEAANDAGINITAFDIHTLKTVQSLASYVTPSREIARCLTPTTMDDSSRLPTVVIVWGATPQPMIEALIDGLKQHFSIILFSPITEQYESADDPNIDFAECIERYHAELKHMLAPDQKIYAVGGHCLGGEIAFALARRWSDDTADTPQVWLFNSTAQRQIEPTDYSWNLTADQEILFRQWLSVSAIANRMIANREMLGYRGKVLFFQALIFTPNLLLPQLPPMTDNPEQLQQMQSDEKTNVENWRKLAPALSIIPLKATHWTLFEPDPLKTIVSKIVGQSTK